MVTPLLRYAYVQVREDEEGMLMFIHVWVRARDEDDAYDRGYDALEEETKHLTAPLNDYVIVEE